MKFYAELADWWPLFSPPEEYEAEAADLLARIGPESEHVMGDMRDLRLGRTFDVVLVHDAVCYATDASQLLATLRTAAAHCKPGGVVVALPVRQAFALTSVDKA